MKISKKKQSAIFKAMHDPLIDARIKIQKLLNDQSATHLNGQIQHILFVAMHEASKKVFSEFS